MRRCAKGVHWTTSDIEFLRENAGALTQREISHQLRKSYWSVYKQAGRLGLSLRVHKPNLQWCNACATWRATISPKTGECAVCRKRSQLIKAKERTADAYRSLSAEQRAVYAESLASRSSDHRKRPEKRPSNPMSRYERSKAEDDYLRDLERWEIDQLNHEIDAEKTLLKRMREKVGTNPRKN